MSMIGALDPHGVANPGEHVGNRVGHHGGHGSRQPSRVTHPDSAETIGGPEIRRRGRGHCSRILAASDPLGARRVRLTSSPS